MTAKTVQNLKNLYEIGALSKEKVDIMFSSGKISRDEYLVIVGEEPV